MASQRAGADWAHVVDHDAGAQLTEQARIGAAEATSSACHDGDAAVKAHGHLSARALSSWERAGSAGRRSAPRNASADSQAGLRIPRPRA